MSEERLNSNKLDIEQQKRLSDGKEELKESYKKISEDSGLDQEESKSSTLNMVRENGEAAQDGADEKMLGSDDKETLALKNIEVKFISGDQNANGDAKIDIGYDSSKQAFTGMTKEELMKYANDPFWVRLRWILFILFWAVWIGMLVGAISIIVFAPKCSAPTPLVWWKKGPLITITGNESADEIEEIKNIKAEGVVYELAADETYFVNTPAVEKKINDIVEAYKAKNIHVVIDLTPNFVMESDELFQAAIKGDEEKLKAFYVNDKADNNWKKFNSSTSAWKTVGNKKFLSQFGEHIDLNMGNEIAQEKLINVIQHLASKGVEGFRFKNAKHFIVNQEFKDEVPHNNNPTSFVASDYGFYTHIQTTYQPELGNVLHKFSNEVRKATKGEGFLTIRDDAGHRLETIKFNDTKVLGISLPRFDFINSKLNLKGSDSEKSATYLKTGFDGINDSIGTSNLWMQIAYDQKDFKEIGASTYNVFISLLPGVQITSLQSLKSNNTELFKKLQEVRESPVLQQGTFNYFVSSNSEAFGYTRVKGGHPGYFVAVNPSDKNITVNFKNEFLSADSLTVHIRSDGVNEDKKIQVDSVPLTGRSATIFTFV